MNPKRVEKILGRNRAWENASKDSDRDGAPNMLDCAPRNPRKQGVTHRFARGVAKKVFKKGKTRSDVMRYIKRREEVSEERKQARHEQRIRAAKEIEKVKADRRIEYERKGGFWGAVGRQTQRLAASPVKRHVAPRRRRKKRAKRTVRKTYSSDFTSGGSFI